MFAVYLPSHHTDGMHSAGEDTADSATISTTVTPADPASSTPPTIRKAPRSRSALELLAISALTVWGVVWLASFAEGRFVIPHRSTWLPAWSFLGLDAMHNVLASQFWLSGKGNPYLDDFGDPRSRFAYPPVVLPLFAWCAALPPRACAIAWTLAVAATCIIATAVARRTRFRLGLPSWPLVVLVALVCVSTPVNFAMERGNCDALVLACVLIAAASIGKRSHGWDALAGFALALAAWIKIYPGLLMLAPLLFRRYRVLGYGIVFGLLIGGVPARYTLQWLQGLAGSQAERFSAVTGQSMNRSSLYPPIEPVSHSFTSYWSTLWSSIDLTMLQAIPGLVGASLVFVPLLGWVGWHIWSRRVSTRLMLPTLLWLATLATFWMPVSYDYNLLFLPLLLISVWSPRDPPLVHALLGPLALWWQPFRMHIGGEPLFLIKFTALVTLTWCLIARVRDYQLHSASRAAEPAVVRTNPQLEV